jgi:HEAT repeat protein
VPAFAGLARHPSAEVRTFAVRFLSAQSQPEAKRALLQALGDRDEAVQRAVLSSLERGAMDSVKPLIELFGREQNWSMRAATADALGRVAEGSSDAGAVRALSRAAEADSYALVREAALRALFRVSPKDARAALERARDKDAEPRVKAVAKSLLETR